MPNYAFACDNDAHGYMEFDAIVALKDYDAMVEQGGIPCPVCEQMAPKIASAPGFALKGTGFHKNDYHAYGPKRK